MLSSSLLASQKAQNKKSYIIETDDGKEYEVEWDAPRPPTKKDFERIAKQVMKATAAQKTVEPADPFGGSFDVQKDGQREKKPAKPSKPAPGLFGFTKEVADAVRAKEALDNPKPRPVRTAKEKPIILPPDDVNIAEFDTFVMGPPHVRQLAYKATEPPDLRALADEARTSFGLTASALSQGTTNMIGLGTRAATNAIGRKAVGQDWQDVTADSGIGQRQERIVQNAVYALPVVGAMKGAIDMAGLGSEALNGNGSEALKQFVGGMAQSANAFEGGIDPEERVARVFNAAMLAIGITHGGIKAYKAGNTALAARELARVLKTDEAGARGILKNIEGYAKAYGTVAEGERFAAANEVGPQSRTAYTDNYASLKADLPTKPTGPSIGQKSPRKKANVPAPYGPTPSFLPKPEPPKPPSARDAFLSDNDARIAELEAKSAPQPAPEPAPATGPVVGQKTKKTKKRQTAPMPEQAVVETPAPVEPAVVPAPEPVAQTKRFDFGKTVTKEERDTILSSLGDSYIDFDLDPIMKGLSKRGEEIWGFPANNVEAMHTSDITGRKIRHYVTLPDGRIAHPSELFPDLTEAKVAAMAKSQYEASLRKRLRTMESEGIITSEQARTAENWLGVMDQSPKAKALVKEVLAKGNPENIERAKIETGIDRWEKVKESTDYPDLIAKADEAIAKLKAELEPAPTEPVVVAQADPRTAGDPIPQADAAPVPAPGASAATTEVWRERLADPFQNAPGGTFNRWGWVGFKDGKLQFYDEVSGDVTVEPWQVTPAEYIGAVKSTYKQGEKAGAFAAWAGGSSATDGKVLVGEKWVKESVAVERLAKQHRKAVEDALKRGEDVPEQILEHYPDLQTNSVPAPAAPSTKLQDFGAANDARIAELEAKTKGQKKRAPRNAGAANLPSADELELLARKAAKLAIDAGISIEAAVKRLAKPAHVRAVVARFDEIAGDAAKEFDREPLPAPKTKKRPQAEPQQAVAETPKTDVPPVEPATPTTEPAQGPRGQIEAAQNEELRRMGFDVDNADKTTVKDILDRADQISEEDADALVAVASDKSSGRQFSDAETARVGRRVNEHFEAANAADAEYAAALERGDAAAAQLALEKGRLADEAAATAMEAIRNSGREWGRAGIARQIEILKDNSEAGLLRRGTRIKQGRLTAEEARDLREHAAAGEELRARIADLEKQNAELKTEADRIKAAAESRKGQVQRQRAERQGAKDAGKARIEATRREIDNAIRELLGKTSAGIDPVAGTKVLRLLGKQVANHIQYGGMALDDAVRTVIEDVKLSHDLDIDERELRKGFLERNKTDKPAKEKSSAQKALADAQKEAALLDAIDRELGDGPDGPKRVADVPTERIRELRDKLAEIRKGKKTKDPDAKRLADLQARLDDALAGRNRPSKPKREPSPEEADILGQIRIEEWRNRLRDRITEYKRQMAQDDYPQPKRRSMPTEIEALYAQERMWKAERDAKMASLRPRTPFEKAETFLSAWQLSNPVNRVIDLLSNATVLVAKGPLSVPRMVAAKATSLATGKPMVDTWLSKAKLDYITGGYGSAVKERLTKQVRGLDPDGIAKFGRGSIVHNLSGVTDVPFNELYYRSHAFDLAEYKAKQVLGSGADKRAVASMRDNILKDLDAHPDVGLAAEELALRDTFNVENVASGAIGAIKAEVKRRAAKSAPVDDGPASMRGQGVSDATGLLLNTLGFRFSKVIGNVALSAANYSPLGLAEGGVRLIRAAKGARKGAAIAPAEMKRVNDLVAKGAVGTAAMVLGYAAADGGLEMGRMDKEGGYIDFGDVEQIGGLAAPFLFGLAWKTIERSDMTDKQKSAMKWKTAAALIMNQPLASGMRNLLRLGESDSMGKKVLQNAATNAVVPGLVKEAARRQDVYGQTGNLVDTGQARDREAKTFYEALVSKVPRTPINEGRPALPLKGSSSSNRSSGPKARRPSNRP